MIRPFLGRIRRRLQRAISPLPAPQPAPAASAAPPAPWDSYAKGRFDQQAAVDIFKGAWSSALPAELGLDAGSAPLFDDPRIHWLIAQLGSIEGWKVFELGPLEGGHSHMLQAAGATSVLAMDACTLSYLKCLLVKELCQLDRVSFQYGDFMAYLAAQPQRFDLIVASGVLYHQRDPLACIELMAAHSDTLFLWTHYYSEQLNSPYMTADMFRPVDPGPGTGLRCTLFEIDYERYLPGGKYRGGVDNHARWMRRDDILACLRQYGFNQIDIAFEHTDHPYGPNFAVLARRQAANALPAGTTIAYRDAMRAIAGQPPWCIDAIALGDGQLTVSGWAIAPAGEVERVGFRVNGIDVVALERGVARPDVGDFYWFYPNAGRAGFRFSHPIDTQANAPLLLQYVDRHSGTVIEPLHDLQVLPEDLRGETAAPPLKLVQRSHTGNAIDQYFVEGYSLFRSLERELVATAGHGLAACGSVLDFGCGPGRLSRYLQTVDGLNVSAVDIDPDCLAWCSSALPGVDCHPGSLRPPLAMAEQSFGAVLAINVLLHLGEHDAVAWLGEWRRLCRPGGLIIVTIAADLALSRARLSEAHYQSLAGQAFAQLSRNPDLDEVIDEPDYYQNVVYSHAHIQQSWPALGLELLRIVPGCIGNHHDLVIMRRV
ncbi:class I SAM-dependent methyltransferase [Chitinimonas sp.]|uniref:class I SAM-dependent methyltransferase n=1 Tax=Chitinimonas sp. TaxID=1934313 RepID=UPI0035B2EEC9